MKTESAPQTVYFSFFPDVPYPVTVIPCLTCAVDFVFEDCSELCPDGPPESFTDYPKPEPWHDLILEGVAPSYAVAASVCNGYLKAVRAVYPELKHGHWTLHVEPYAGSCAE